MSNFATQFKAEISRIAKKEVRSETVALKKSSAHYRSEIAALKRRVSSLEATVRRLAETAAGSGPVAHKEAAEPPALRFRVGGFASLRRKLGLSAAEMGRLLGVSGQSVYHWEAGKTRPRPAQLQAIAAVRKMGKREVAEKLAASF